MTLRSQFLIGLLVVTALLGGCGRRGPLEPPPGAIAPADVPQFNDDEVDPSGLTKPQEDPVGKEGRKIPPPQKAICPRPDSLIHPA